MKITFVTFGNFDGHATLKRATGMAKPLIEAGCEVSLLLEDCLVNREKVSMECPEASVFWHVRGSSSGRERKAKQRTLDTLRPDVIWICGVGFRNWIRKTHKECLVLADHSELYSQVTVGSHRQSLYRLLEWIYCFAFDGHICASRYLENFYKKRLRRLGKNPGVVHYSPYAYHPGVIGSDPDGAVEINASYSGKKIILYMGSFWPNYGFWDMLEAFKALSEKRNDFIALFAGRGPEKERGVSWVLENKLNENIVIEGYVPEELLSAYFEAAHAFLSPLRDTVQDWARCPSKLYMYLPFKKPIITCPIGEAKELFGDKGFFYTPGDVESLSIAIERALDDGSQQVQIDQSGHTYATRTEEFLKWCNQIFHIEK